MAYVIDILGLLSCLSSALNFPFLKKKKKLALNKKYKCLILPTTILETGIFCFATCIHPPGAAHKSTKTLDFCRKLNFLFNCINLNAARDLKPEKLQKKK